MSRSNAFVPRTDDPTLVIASDSPIDIPQTKAAIRTLLTRYYGPAVAMMMVHVLTYNIFYNRDRSQQAIVITSDGLPLGESIIIDLYARLFIHAQGIKIDGRSCRVSLRGNVDHNRLEVLFKHYLWLGAAFGKKANSDAPYSQN